MQKGNNLKFKCQSCSEPVDFSLFKITKERNPVECRECGKRYLFDDDELLSQLGLFEALCIQIKKSESILGKASVGVDMQDTQVKIPFKILLTRLTNQLDLVIGEAKTPISFRFEPLDDLSS